MPYAIFMLAVTLLLLGGCGKRPEPLTHHTDCQAGSIYAMNRAECIDPAMLLDMLEPYPVLFLGDHHKSEALHAFAASLIEGLSRRGYRVHLANEWFSPADNALLDTYASGAIDDGNFTKKVEWKTKAGYDFDLFAPIYHAVREGGGKLYGVNLSKAARKKISDANLTGMDEAELAFYRSLDLNVSAHRQMVAPFMKHCTQQSDTRNCEERMYRVQVAWDSKMGQESARLAQRVLTTPREKLIVFVGAMHLNRDLGVNMRFSRLSYLPHVTILPALHTSMGYLHGTADFLYLLDPSPQPGE